MQEPRHSSVLEACVVVAAAVLAGLAVAAGRPSWAVAAGSVAVLAGIAHRPRLGLWLMILLLPLIPGFSRSPMERFVDYGLSLLILYFLVFQKLQQREPVRLPPSALTVWFFAFLAWTIFTSFFAVAPFKGFAQAFRYSQVFLALVCFWNLWELSTLRRGLLLMTVILSFIGAYGIYQFASIDIQEIIYSQAVGIRRLNSIYENVNDLGGWMSHGLVILVPFFLHRASRQWTLGRGVVNVLLLVVGALLLGGAFVSFSRASYLYIFTGCACIALCHRRLRWLVLGGAGTALVWMAFFPLPPWAAFSLRLEAGSSFRTSLWAAGLRMMLDHPWTGVGTGSSVFSLVRPQYLSPDVHRELLKSQAGGAHNVFISRGAEMGILGLVLTLILFLMLWIRIPQALRDYRRGDWLAGAAAAGVVGLSVRGLFERSFTLGLGTVGDSLVFFLFAMILIGRRRWDQGRATIPASPSAPPS